MELDITKCSAEDLDVIYSQEIYELTLNGPFIHSKNEDPNDNSTPIPWDAAVEIDESSKEVEITGSVGPSGFGSCICTVPLKDFNKTYHFYLEPNNEDDRQELNKIFANTSVITKEDFHDH